MTSKKPNESSKKQEESMGPVRSGPDRSRGIELKELSFGGDLPPERYLIGGKSEVTKSEHQAGNGGLGDQSTPLPAPSYSNMTQYNVAPSKQQPLSRHQKLLQKLDSRFDNSLKITDNNDIAAGSVSENTAHKNTMQYMHNLQQQLVHDDGSVRTSSNIQIVNYQDDPNPSALSSSTHHHPYANPQPTHQEPIHLD